MFSQLRGSFVMKVPTVAGRSCGEEESIYTKICFFFFFTASGRRHEVPAGGEASLRIRTEKLFR
jgi:hypothetical protein